MKTLLRTAMAALFIVGYGTACPTAFSRDPNGPPLANPPAGEVRGVSENGNSVFRAIPYAQAPIGPLRWRPPVEIPRWQGVRAAEKEGVACMQPPMAPGIYTRGKMRMSEDCLTLDVTAPKGAKNAPVMVWIHGGTLIWGTGHSSMYAGHEFAKRGIVLVSINYRLGVFGYLAHPDLSKESTENVSGNYGLLDQIAALQWVRKNIAAFGGDPKNVTIFGESAGALSTEYLLASPRAQGLFERAIVQSGYLFTMPELREAKYEEQSAESIGTYVSTKLGVDGIAGLRIMDADNLLKKVTTTGYLPYGTIDGKILKRQLVDTFELGEQAQVPVMAGFNSGEVRTLRHLLAPIPDSGDAYVKDIKLRYSDLSDTYLKLYPGRDAEETRLAVARDVVFGWAAERLVRSQARFGQPSYLYYFDHFYPAQIAANVPAFHASEVPFVFGTLNKTPTFWPAIPDSPVERKFSAALLDYWSSFARDGRPVSQHGPYWQSFAPNRAFMYFGATPQMARGLMPGMFELHEQVMCRRKASGLQTWNWRAGSIAPILPEPSVLCTPKQ